MIITQEWDPRLGLNTSSIVLPAVDPATDACTGARGELCAGRDPPQASAEEHPARTLSAPAPRVKEVPATRMRAWKLSSVGFIPGQVWPTILINLGLLF